jgi:hypothetical protein
VFQGILFLCAALTFFVPRSSGLFPASAAWPQPWLPLAFLASLMKAALR